MQNVYLVSSTLVTLKRVTVTSRVKDDIQVAIFTTFECPSK